jgi:hypothetical protein
MAHGAPAVHQNRAFEQQYYVEPNQAQPGVFGARFWQKFTLEDAIGSQWHPSRVFTPLTGSHCKFRPNTEGTTPLHTQPLVVGTACSVLSDQHVLEEVSLINTPTTWPWN